MNVVLSRLLDLIVWANIVPKSNHVVIYQSSLRFPLLTFLLFLSNIGCSIFVEFLISHHILIFNISLSALNFTFKLTSYISQALFYSALRCSREMIIDNDGSRNLVRAINNRLSSLSFHIREYYWVDMKKINEIYRYKTQEYSHDAINKFNIYPEQIPAWLVEWVPDEGGYLIGNLQPAHMDFRFSIGNIWAVASSLATTRHALRIFSVSLKTNGII